MNKEITFVKPPKWLDRNIHLEFHGNLDTAILKMKKDQNQILTDKDKLQLKIFWLFLHGMSNTQIKEHVYLGVSQIKVYLREKRLNDLLSFEYQIILQMNQYRLHFDDRNQKVKDAVVVLVEQNGNRKKTAEILGCPYRTLQKYLATPNLKRILDSELYQQYLTVKNKRGSRNYAPFFTKEYYPIIKKALDIYIAQNGNVTKTASLMNCSKVTIREYLSHPDLEVILENDEWYQKIIKTRKRKQIETKKEEKSEIWMYAVTTVIEKLKPRGGIQKNYVLICKAMLLKQLKDTDLLMNETKLDQKTLKYYLKNISKHEHFFSNTLLKLLKQETTQYLQKLETDYCKGIIHMYLSGRYTYYDIKTMVNGKLYQINRILGCEAKQVLSTEEYEALQAHKKEVTSIYNRMTGYDQILIKDANMINLVKPNILFVTKPQYRILLHLIEFLKIYENIDLENDEKSMYFLVNILSQNMSLLEELLKEEIYQKVNSYLKIERLLFGKELQKKYAYTIRILRSFLLNSMDLVATAQEQKIFIVSLIRVLKEEYIHIHYGDVISMYIDRSILEYRKSCKEQKVLHKTGY